MKYKEFTVGNTEYKLRLGANECVNCEEKLGKPLLGFVMGMSQMKEKGPEVLPKLQELMLILHACLVKLNHGIDMKKTYEIYDDYIDNGGSYTELIGLLVEVLNESGFLK